MGESTADRENCKACCYSFSLQPNRTYDVHGSLICCRRAILTLFDLGRRYRYRSLVSHAGEVISALTPGLEKSLSSPSSFRAKEQLAALERAWSEVISVERVRERARRLLEIHPLRAADSLQLGAALLTSEETPQGFPFVTLDRRLADAAEKEGFHVVGV